MQPEMRHASTFKNVQTQKIFKELFSQTDLECSRRCKRSKISQLTIPIVYYLWCLFTQFCDAQYIDYDDAG